MPFNNANFCGKTPSVTQDYPKPALYTKAKIFAFSCLRAKEGEKFRDPKPGDYENQAEVRLKGLSMERLIRCDI
jgi:hypothetical protein